MTTLDVLNHLPALPEAVLLVGACVVMIADVYSGDERRRLAYWLAQGTLGLCLLATLFVVANAGANKYYLFNGLFVADFMSHLIKLVSYAAVSAAPSALPCASLR